MATTVTLKPNAIDISGSTSGTTTLQATAVAGTTVLTLPAATDTLVGKATTDTLTNKTLTSPVLTTPALGTPASGVVTNLTGTASININGTVGATTASTGAFTTLSATGVTTVQAGTAALPAITTSGDTNTGIFFPAADTIAFTEGGAEAMRIDSSGNVGIGVTPAKKLDVKDSAATSTTAFINQIFQLRSNGSGADATIQFTDSVTYNSYFGSGGGNFYWNTTGTERMRIDSSGNVGIGTASPSNKLHVVGTAKIEGSTLDLNDAGTFTISQNTSASALVLRTAASSYLRFDTNGSNERMRIDPDGRVMINQTSGATTNTVLEVKGISSAVLSRWQIGTDGFKGFQFINAAGATEVGSIVINNASTTYATSSDYRLKEDITPMTDALTTVAALKPVAYKWKATGEATQGFIAHELQAVVPECVVGEKDGVETYIDEDGNEATRPAYQGIDTSFLVATLTAALQEAHGLIKNLEQRVAALEAV